MNYTSGTWTSLSLKFPENCTGILGVQILIFRCLKIIPQRLIELYDNLLKVKNINVYTFFNIVYEQKSNCFIIPKYKQVYEALVKYLKTTLGGGIDSRLFVYIRKYFSMLKYYHSLFCKFHHSHWNDIIWFYKFSFSNEFYQDQTFRWNFINR